MPNRPRWRELGAHPSPWRGRIAVIASYIRPGASVVDIGSCAQDLRALLPSGCTYTPMDCVPGPDVVLIDLDDQATLPTDRHFDYAVLSGVLEHVKDPSAALAYAKTIAHKVIFSWAPWAGAHPAPSAVAIDRWSDQGIYQL